MKLYFRIFLVAALILVPCAALAHVRLITGGGVPLRWAAPASIGIVINDAGSDDIADDSDEVAIRMAIEGWNAEEEFKNVNSLFLGIRILIWIVGTATLLAGVVGVSNIMMIVVRERTKEIGVRKALGATPANIVGTIVQEAVFLTAVAGYLGLVAGVAALSLVEWAVPANDMFREPRVDLSVAIAATVVLIVSGALAGLFPALAAAKVNPIVALRDE